MNLVLCYLFFILFVQSSVLKCDYENIAKVQLIGMFEYCDMEKGKMHAGLCIG
jgi:hypothetical protein